jgi:hypothetical protein
MVSLECDLFIKYINHNNNLNLNLPIKISKIISLSMELDWITLYDYMSVFSRSDIKLKINKFYESFYPLKFKKTGKKVFELVHI